MYQFSFLIIEDSAIEALALHEQLKKLMFFESKTVHTLEEAFQIISKEPIDLIFLDIRLANNQNGLQFIRNFKHLPPTIITTAYPEYGIEVFDIDEVVDFLVKPYSDLRLMRAIDRSLKLSIKENSIADKNSIFLKTGRKLTRFEYSQILYCQAYGLYSKVITTHGIEAINERFASLEESLPKNTFKRVHKSYIININKISGFDNKFFYISEEKKIPIGPIYKEALEPFLRLLSKN